MNVSGKEAALSRLRARRRQIERELARVERKIARAGGQVVALRERIAGLTQSDRRAA